MQEQFLKYVSLLPSASVDLDEIRNQLENLGYKVEDTNINIINEGEEHTLYYTVNEEINLAFALGWGGSTLKLSVYRPDGTIFIEREASVPPIIIEVP